MYFHCSRAQQATWTPKHPSVSIQHGVPAKKLSVPLPFTCPEERAWLQTALAPREVQGSALAAGSYRSTNRCRICPALPRSSCGR